MFRIRWKVAVTYVSASFTERATSGVNMWLWLRVTKQILPWKSMFEPLLIESRIKSNLFKGLFQWLIPQLGGVTLLSSWAYKFKFEILKYAKYKCNFKNKYLNSRWLYKSTKNLYMKSINTLVYSSLFKSHWYHHPRNWNTFFLN